MITNDILTNQNLYYKLYLAEALEWHSKGDLTIKGLIKSIILCAKKKGQKLVLTSVKDFCQLLQISRKDFYKAKARLILEGIRIEVTGKLTMWVEEDNDDVITLTQLGQPTVTSDSSSSGVVHNNYECNQKVTQCNQKVTPCNQKVTDSLYKELPIVFPEVSPSRAHTHTEEKLAQEKNLEETEQAVNTGFVGQNNQTVETQAKDSSKDQFSGACDNKSKKQKFLVSEEKIQELEKLYELGEELEITSQDELKALASRVFPERIKLYRNRTGRILGGHINDIDRGFLKFFAWRYWGNESELKRAMDTIRSYESDPTKWQVLCLAVDEWQDYLANPEKLAEEAKRRAAYSNSEVDDAIASRSELAAFQKIALQQEQLKKAREAARNTPKQPNPPKEDSRGADDSPSPQSEEEFVKAPIPEEVKRQLEELRKKNRSRYQFL